MAVAIGIGVDIGVDIEVDIGVDTGVDTGVVGVGVSVGDGVGVDVGVDVSDDVGVSDISSCTNVYGGCSAGRSLEIGEGRYLRPSNSGVIVIIVTNGSHGAPSTSRRHTCISIKKKNHPQPEGINCRLARFVAVEGLFKEG